MRDLPESREVLRLDWHVSLLLSSFSAPKPWAGVTRASRAVILIVSLKLEGRESACNDK